MFTAKEQGNSFAKAIPLNKTETKNIRDLKESNPPYDTSLN